MASKPKKQVVAEIWEEMKTATPEQRKAIWDKWGKKLPDMIVDPYNIDSVTEKFSDKAAFGFGDFKGTNSRNQVKNFSNSVYDAIQYLEERHPDMEFGYKKNEIYARKPGTEEWQPLDPGPGNYLDWKKWLTGENVGEAFQDVGDASYEVSTGIPRTILAAIAAAKAGPMAVPAASATNAATGALNEGIRQQIGKWKGVNKSIDPYQVAGSAIVDGVATPIFGTGLSGSMEKAIPKKFIEQYRKIAQKSLDISEAEAKLLSNRQILDEAGKSLRYGGVVPKVISTTGTGVKTATEFMTGKTSRAIQTLANRRDALMDDIQQTVPFARKFQTSVHNSVVRGGERARQALDEALPSGENFYVGEVRNHLKKLQQEYEAMLANPRVSKGAKIELQRVLNDPTTGIKEIRSRLKLMAPDRRLSGQDYVNYKTFLGTIADFDKAAVQTAADNRVQGMISDAAKSTKKVMEDVARKDYPKLGAAAEQFSQALEDSKNLPGLIGQPGRTAGLRKRIGAPEAGGSVLELNEIATRNMTPKEQAKYFADRDALHMNMQYFNDIPVDLPVGTMKLFGAGGAVTLKGTPSKVVADVGARTLQGGQAVGKVLRTGAPAAVQAANANSDSVLRALGLGQFAQTPLTLDPETEEEQSFIFKKLQGLGSGK